MFHKIEKIKPLSNFHLLATFTDGTIKKYDMQNIIKKHDAFNDLVTIPNLFEQVKVDIGGYGIMWNDYIDLSSDEIWHNGF